MRQVSGAVEREIAKDMIVRYSPGAKRITVGGDKGFDTADFVSDMRDFNVTPHVAQTRPIDSPPSTVALSATADTRSVPAEAQTGRGANRVGQDHRRIGAANAAWREKAGLHVHADNGCLRSHQVAQVDRSNRLNDSRLPNGQCCQRFKLVDNANPEPMPLELHFQQPARRRSSVSSLDRRWLNWPPFRPDTGIARRAWGYPQAHAPMSDDISGLN
jgi:hypothetical protein